MNTKDTVILLIFLFSIVGLLIEIYYTEDISSKDSHETSFEKICEEKDGILTITLEKKENNELSNYFT